MDRCQAKAIKFDTWQWNGVSPNTAAPSWIIEAVRTGRVYMSTYNDKHRLYVVSSFGTAELEPGDWIIRNVSGEMTPIKKSEFNLLYEEAAA